MVNVTFLPYVTSDKASDQLSALINHLLCSVEYFLHYIHFSTVSFALSVMVQKLFWKSSTEAVIEIISHVKLIQKGV